MLGFLNRNLYHAPQHIKEYTYKPDTGVTYHHWITVVQSGTLILKRMY